MPTEEKRQAVTELADLLRSSSAMAVADYRGLKVSEMQAVRRTLRDNGVQLTIAKNRLLKIAADEAERPELKPMLTGPTALAIDRSATRRRWPRPWPMPSARTRAWSASEAACSATPRSTRRS